ncbi:MAG: hypothetical protein A3H02_01850 [Candidatus Niyogibacteria bacterium RIFCSPLOWO2_12_FULL_41_13]|uniref:PEGA domain-containing protein n=1 Tax=Candidatus Niyogibacteria bacterium RIFCSPLOWO2_12_FULL_41_13 TaxID=1801726 RepID=A0A1G2F3X9_9BACT|nr:MAG: hypothetical protein A3H02_01850 [Candidatus Niyogibacteria bacterium RIFCSPLOWO2_12_FULL_41_13]
MPQKTRKILFWSLFSVFIVLAIIIPAYQAGYRIDQNFNIAQVGGIFLALPENGNQIYLDGKLEKETGYFSASFYIENLKPKNYSVIVAKDGYWPWTKQLEIKENMVTEAKPFLLKKNIEGKPVENNEEIMNEFLNRDSFALKTNNKNNIEIRKENGKIIARWKKGPPLPYYFSKEEQIIFQTINEIKNFEFFPKRSDLVVLALRNGIFALEIDGRGLRNFQPIYKGFDPDFVLIENKFYIRDQNAVFEIKL